MEEVADFWHMQLCRCYSLRKTILIACVNNGSELAQSQEFSHSWMYKTTLLLKEGPQ